MFARFKRRSDYGDLGSAGSAHTVACVGAFLYVRYYYVQRVGRTPRRTAAVRSTTQVEQA